MCKDILKQTDALNEKIVNMMDKLNPIIGEELQKLVYLLDGNLMDYCVHTPTTAAPGTTSASGSTTAPLPTAAAE